MVVFRHLNFASMLLYSSSLPPASLLKFMPPVQLSYSFLLSSLWTSSLPILWAFHVLSCYWPFWLRDRIILTVSSLYFFSYTTENLHWGLVLYHWRLALHSVALSRFLLYQSLIFWRLFASMPFPIIFIYVSNVDNNMRNEINFEL